MRANISRTSFDYSLTKSIYYSDNSIAKVARYSLIGITSVAIVETIYEIAKYILNSLNTQNVSKEENPVSKFAFITKIKSSQILLTHSHG